MNYCRYLEETGTINPRQVILRNNKQFLELNCLRIGENSPSPRLSYRTPPILSTISIPPSVSHFSHLYSYFPFVLDRQMTDELLFSALGLSMDTGHVERQLFSSDPAAYAREYEGSSSCRTTPHSDDSEIGDPHATNVGNGIGCYTDLSCPAKGQSSLSSSSSSWNEWSDNNSTSLSGEGNFQKLRTYVSSTSVTGLLFRHRMSERAERAERVGLRAGMVLGQRLELGPSREDAVVHSGLRGLSTPALARPPTTNVSTGRGAVMGARDRPESARRHVGDER